MSEALVLPPRNSTERAKLAANWELRQQIIAALQSGLRPMEVARRLRKQGVTTQRVWNIATQLERAATSVGVKPGVRICLSCGIPFHSWGAGNRRCTSCRGDTDTAGPYEASLSHNGIRLR